MEKDCSFGFDCPGPVCYRVQFKARGQKSPFAYCCFKHAIEWLAHKFPRFSDHGKGGHLTIRIEPLTEVEGGE